MCRTILSRFTSFLLLALFLGLAPAQAQVAGISYTLSPEAEYLFWNNESGITGGFMYGGQIGLGFGQYVELSGIYQRSVGVSSDVGQFLDEDLGLSLTDRDVELRRLGGELKLNVGRLNLGPNSILPFITAGTGVLRSTPEGLEKTENIYLNLGLGVMYSLFDRYTLSLQAENLSYRQNAATAFFTGDELVDLGLTPDDFASQRVSNYGLRASVALHLGGRNPDTFSELDNQLRDQFGAGLSGLRFPVEPFIGQIRFNEALGFSDRQRLAGVNAGLEFGPYIGIRGFYWRGVPENEIFSFDQLQMYGGEMKFRLNSGQGLIPFLTTGAGYLDVLSGYEGVDETRPDDQYFALVGGGLEFPITPNFWLNAGIRSLLASTEDVEDLTSTDKVYNSFLYSVGVNFAIGSGRSEAPDIVRRETMEAELDSLRSEATERELALEDDILQARRTNDSLRAAMDTERMRADSLRMTTGYAQENLAQLDQSYNQARTNNDSLALSRFDAQRTQADTRVDSLQALLAQQNERIASITNELERRGTRMTDLERRRQDVSDVRAATYGSYDQYGPYEQPAGRAIQTTGNQISLPFFGEGELLVRFTRPEHARVTQSQQASEQAAASSGNTSLNEDDLRNLVREIVTDVVSEQQSASQAATEDQTAQLDDRLRTVEEHLQTADDNGAQQAIDERLSTIEERLQVANTDDTQQNVNERLRGIEERLQSLLDQRSNVKVVADSTSYMRFRSDTTRTADSTSVSAELLKLEH